VKAEAERLRQQREMQHEEEFSQLKLAEEELVQVCDSSLANCVIYLYTLTEYINRFAVDRMGTFFFTMLPSMKFAEEKVLVFFIFREKC